MAADGHLGYTKMAITLTIDVMFSSMIRFSGSADLMVPLSMTLSDPEPQFQGHNIFILKANISQTVHLIHSMSASGQGFSGSADRMTLFPVQ